MEEKNDVPESNLERLARTIRPEQVKALIGTFYKTNETALLLDADYRFVMATRAAELRLGYSSDQILIDSLKLQPEVFKRLREICQEQFDKQGKKFFELKGVPYSSSNKETSFLFNIKACEKCYHKHLFDIPRIKFELTRSLGEKTILQEVQYSQKISSLDDRVLEKEQMA
ncbi:MAG: hypothetical protein QXF14_01790 [Candidatus Woesearchaeota archaeon]